MKYWMCEFHEQNGEHEYKYQHIYNDQQLDDIGHEGDDHDYRILNHFFIENIKKDDEDGSGYWTGDGCRMVRFENVMTNILIRKIKMTEEMMEEILDNWIVWSKEIQQNNKSTWSQRDDAIVRAITKILEEKLYEYKKQY